MNMQLSPNEETKVKSFWERPEGTTGMLVLAGGAIGLYFAVPVLLAFAASVFALLGYTIGIVVLLAILAGILVVLSDKRFRVLMSLGFKMVMRKLTNAVVTIDPIGVRELFIEKMKKKRTSVSEARSKLSSQETKLNSLIQDSGREYQDAMNMATVAHAEGNSTQMQLLARKSARLESLARETLIPLRDQISQHLRIASKVYEACGFIIEDMEDDVRIRRLRAESVEASFSLIQASHEILHGGTEDRVLYDAAGEADLNEYHAKLGAVEMFLEDSRPVLEGFDLKNGVLQQQALARIEQWSKGDAFNFDLTTLSHRKSATAVEVKSFQPSNNLRIK